ncbi:MAG: TrkA family potassium uptake protein [Candidatus Krumholzibacteriota bacterium]|nr:TrkA family potassium uptake protein [Candidatus Krumholzibacteriota bacterium]
MKVLIVGGGKPVYFLCKAFIAKGYDVTVINRDHAECVAMARTMKITVVHGDGTDSTILDEAGAHSSDAILSVTPNDQDNLVACQLGRVRYGVPRVVALVEDPDNEAVFRKLGVEVISMTRNIASMIEQRTALDDIINLIPAGEGKVNITEVKLKDDSPVIGNPLHEVSLPAGSLIAVVLRGDEAIIPRGDTVLRAGDSTILITLPENHGPVLRAVTGEEN